MSDLLRSLAKNEQMSELRIFEQIAHTLIFGQKTSYSLRKPMSEVPALLKTHLPILGPHKNQTFFYLKISVWLLFFEVIGRYLQIFRKKMLIFKVPVNFENENFAACMQQIRRFFGIRRIKLHMIGSIVTVFENRKKVLNHSTLIHSQLHNSLIL